MELIPSTFYFDFLGKRFFAFAFSAVLILGTIAVWVSKGDLKYGIDYIGGHELIVAIAGETNSEAIQEMVVKGGIPEATAQVFDPNAPGAKEYSIRVPGAGMEPKVVRDKIESILKAEFKDGVTIQKTDFVGPTVGSELKRKSIMALTLGLLVILGYVSYRFEFSFALGAVVALFHDVIVATGVYLAAGHQLNLASLAAALTIVGYSVNDTIVIFDKVREDLKKMKNPDLAKVLNDAMNSLLSRTLLTSILTLFSALALWLFGGGAIGDLSLFLVAGVITGSYSTIFIAAPVVLAWEAMRGKRQPTVQQNQKRAAAA